MTTATASTSTATPTSTATAAADAAKLAAELAAAAGNSSTGVSAPGLGSIVIMNDYVNSERRDFPAIVTGLNTDGTLAVFALPAGQQGRPIKSLSIEGKQKAGTAYYKA